MTHRIWSLAEIDADTRPVPADIVAGFIPGKQAVLLSGPGGDGKSYACLDLAIHVAAGIPWLGLNVRQVPVLVIDLENEFVRLRERIRELLWAHGLSTTPPPVHVAFGLDLRLSRDEGAIEIADMAAQVGAGLVILDSLVDFLGDVDENSNPQMGKVAERLRNITLLHDCSALGIHHTPKTNNATPRGASALRNGISVCILATRNGNTITMAQDKNRVGAEKTVIARLDWGPGTFDMSPMGITTGRVAKSPDADEKAILHALNDGGWHPSNDVVNTVMNNSKHKRSTIHSKLSAMIKDAVLEKKDAGDGVPYDVRLNPYYAAMQP